jgi:hypothetical protein
LAGLLGMGIDHSLGIYIHKPKNRKFFCVLDGIRIHDLNVRPSKATPAPRGHYDIVMLRFSEEYEKYVSLLRIVISSAKQTKKGEIYEASKHDQNPICSQFSQGSKLYLLL